VPWPCASAGNLEKWAAADGRKLPTDTGAFIADLVGSEIPYEEVINITANWYVGHFTAAELNEVAAFHRTAVYRKQIGLMPTLMAEAGQEIQQVMLARRADMEAKIKARFGAVPKTP